MPPLPIPSSSDPKKDMKAFLESIKGESYGPILSDIHSFLRTSKDNDDAFLRRQKNRLQKSLEDERDTYEKLTSDWVNTMQSGFQSRVEGLMEGGSLNDSQRVKYLDTVDNWFLRELQTYQDQMKARKKLMVANLSKIDKDSFESHRAKLVGDEDKLLDLFWKLKTGQDTVNAIARIQMEKEQDRLEEEEQRRQDNISSPEVTPPSSSPISKAGLQEPANGKKRRVSESD